MTSPAPLLPAGTALARRSLGSAAPPVTFEDLLDAVEARLSRPTQPPLHRVTPAHLRELSAAAPREVLLSAPQPGAWRLELWRLRAGGDPLGLVDLMELIDLAVTAVAARRRWTAWPAPVAGTVSGRRIGVHGAGAARERATVGECGLAGPSLLETCGLPGQGSGLVLRLRLDRLADAGARRRA